MFKHQYAIQVSMNDVTRLLDAVKKGDQAAAEEAPAADLQGAASHLRNDDGQ